MALGMSELVAQVVRLRYPGYAFILFYGSHSRADRSTTPSSDVDVMVVYTEHVKPYRETFRAEGYLFDVFVYDAETINFILNDRRPLADLGVFLHIVCDAIVLPAANAVSDHLKGMARLRMLDVPKAIDSTPLRHSITNALDDLEWCCVPAERTLLMVDIYKSVVMLLLGATGSSGQSNRHAVRAIESVEPGFFAELNACFLEALQQACAAAFIGHVTRILEKQGGVSREGFRLPLPDGKRLMLTKANFMLNVPIIEGAR